MEYFERLLALLKIEREEDKQAYLKQTESSSAAERRAAGLAWYPIAIRGTEMTRGDYLSVELERTTHQELPHQFRFGMPVELFSNHDPKEYRIEAVINHQSGNRMRITLRTDELPDWSRDGKLGVNLLFDDNSYDEMQEALQKASRETVKNHLFQVLTGETFPTFGHSALPFPTLNTFQQDAVNKILSANELAVVHGPPGTGKTTTLVQAIKALWERDRKQILVVAPSNTAVDLLSEKLSEAGMSVLRVGNPVRVSERLQSLTLDSKMSDHARIKEIKTLKKRASEFKNMAHKYKRQFGKAEREQRKALFDEAHRIMKEVEAMEQYIIEDVTTKTQVVTATFVGSNHYTVRDLTFDTVIIDEAGQSLEPACWISIRKAKRVIMAGDHCQLPPTVKSSGAAALNRTLLEKCVELHPEAVVLLEEQYRMNKVIMGYSSDVFYDGRLKAYAGVADQVLFAGEAPLTFVDTAGCGFDEKPEGTSVTNPEEASLVLRHLTDLVTAAQKHYPQENFPTIAVIAPYKQQVNVLNEQLPHFPVLKELGNRLAINTVDSFQGQERDIVYLSMTRSNTEGEIGFLSDIRRMNVAMTRARKKLVVVGDSGTLSVLPYYEEFIAYAERHDAYRSAWDWM